MLSLQVAYHTLSILLGLVYCIIQPVMAPLVMFYFLISLAIAKYGLLPCVLRAKFCCPPKLAKRPQSCSDMIKYGRHALECCSVRDVSCAVPCAVLST